VDIEFISTGGSRNATGGRFRYDANPCLSPCERDLKIQHSLQNGDVGEHFGELFGGG
jgi:hypothetical protein